MCVCTPPWDETRRESGGTLFFIHTTFSSLTVVLIKIINHCVEAGWLWRDGPVCDYVLAHRYLARLRCAPLPYAADLRIVFFAVLSSLFSAFFAQREPNTALTYRKSSLSTPDINCTTNWPIELPTYYNRIPRLLSIPLIPLILFIYFIFASSIC